MRWILGGELEDGEQQFLGREEQKTVLHRREEGGSHVADEADEWLRVACIGQTLGLRECGMEPL